MSEVLNFSDSGDFTYPDVYYDYNNNNKIKIILFLYIVLMVDIILNEEDYLLSENELYLVLCQNPENRKRLCG